MNELTQIKTAEMLEAINRSEVDIQISTAKMYPRSIAESIQKVRTMATIDEATAEGCFYTLRRQDSKGSSTVIEGPTVRLAEIIASSWGNLRVQTNIIGNDGKFITARGVCHDLESNLAVSCEVKRRITTKEGKTFSEDMQVVTGNAAGAIAFRNAIFKVVPMAVLQPVINEIRDKAKGQSTDLEQTRTKILAYFASLGVSEEILLDYLGIQSITEMTPDMMFQLKGVKNAIKEGATTAQQEFIEPYNAKKATAKKKTETTAAKSKIEEALNRQTDDMPIFQ